MFLDRAHDALKMAAVETRERIRRDREGLPHPLTDLLAYLEEHLFDGDLNVDSARRAVRIRDNSFSTAFRAYLGKTPRVYLEHLRLETADRMLRKSRIEPGRVARAVGFTDYSTFHRAYTAWAGERPSDARQMADEPEVDYPTWRRAWRGWLSWEEGRRLIEALRRIYPDRDPDDDEPHDDEPRVEVDGDAYEGFRAEALWQRIRRLPGETQRRHVERHVFHSPALFDLLRRKSREEGREDRRRGIALAELALVSLDHGDEVFGERIHDLRALGRAWLGNARRLALDFSGAESAFKEARDEWHKPRQARDQLVLAEICYLESGLREFQRRFDEAVVLADRAIAIFESLGAPVRVAEVLMARASTLGYAGNPEATIPDLRRAAEIVEREGQDFLTLAAQTNLATSCALAGRHREAGAVLPRARKLCQALDNQLVSHQLEWIEGLVHQGEGFPDLAEEWFAEARKGFVQLGETLNAADLSLSLAILYSKQGRESDVLELAVEMIPVFDALRIHREGAAAFKILDDALPAKQLPLAVLREVQEHLEKARRDPVLRFRLDEMKKAGSRDTNPDPSK